MLHACLLPITLCFTGTSWCFYGFSATNILTTCHSASFCFLLFLIPEKLQKKYSRNRKRKLFYEVSYRKSPGARRGHPGGPGGPTQPPGAPQPCWPRPGMVWPTRAPPGSVLSPIYLPRTKNPGYSREIPRKV